MNDFSTSTNTPTEDPLLGFEQSIQNEIGSLNQRLKDAKSFQTFLNELRSCRDKGWKLHVKALCEKHSQLLRSLRKDGHSCVPIVEALYRDAKEYAHQSAHMIPVNIERLAEETQVAIDRKSRHPRYFFSRGGFIEATVDDQKLVTTIKTREGRLASFPSDPEAILETVLAEEERLFKRKFSGTQFLKDLNKGYRACIKGQQDAKYGDPVPIREVYACLAKKKRGYKKDEFLVDLSNLVAGGPAEVSGEQFGLQQTKDTHSGVLLLGVAGQGMVNLIFFRKATGEAHE